MSLSEVALRSALIGVGATIMLDIWASLAQRLLGIPRPDWGMFGRWIGHIPDGRWFHSGIAASRAMPGERVMGWCAHYAVGIVFAAMLLVLAGPAWFRNPTFLPAFTMGVVTVAAPFFILQPAMGAGVAGSRTPSPWRTRSSSLLSHSVFGLGLYVAAVLVAELTG
ncbi:MAG: DUF2938 domain-containing protein [Sphingopyxis sp.]|uniref:DUF2938 domain-containing protein n=1 Tax=Sphingopyxis sp. TaxID=1908224 RepID=UPI002ABC720C|nr:DUF2938 domain-containing protein [Sphingopyxis sp.]MDZ3832902.1 DUF2938 domain-containing protein [Sphingopyxis sp.]